MEIQECPHCSKRVVAMKDGTCPACRNNFHDEPQPKQPTAADSRQAAWAEFQQSHEGRDAEDPLRTLRQAESEFLDLRTRVVAEPASRSAANTKAAERIRQELLPRLQDALDLASASESVGEASVATYLAARQKSWQRLADALQNGDADALAEHLDLWESSERQGLEFASEGESYVKPEGSQLVQEFQNALATFTPRLIATPAIVAINILIFVLMVATGVDAYEPTAESVVAWGADFGPLTMNGEWWRLVTNVFLHFGVLHLAFNMWVLWDVGTLLERLVGNVGFVVLYLICGIAGSLASLAWNSYVVAAGASGAVFGVAGALLGFMMRSRGTIPNAVLKHLRGSVGAFIAYNVLFGLSIQGIDNAAHVGGLVAGLVCGLLLSQPLGPEMPRCRLRRNLALLAVGSSALLLAALALPEAPVDLPAEMQEISKIEVGVLETHEQLARQARRGTLSDAEFASHIEREILPIWQELRQRMISLGEEPHANHEKLTALAEYMQIREEAWQMMAESMRNQDGELFARSQDRWMDANRSAEQLESQ